MAHPYQPAKNATHTRPPARPVDSPTRLPPGHTSPRSQVEPDVLGHRHAHRKASWFVSRGVFCFLRKFWYYTTILYKPYPFHDVSGTQHVCACVDTTRYRWSPHARERTQTIPRLGSLCVAACGPWCVPLRAHHPCRVRGL